MVELVAVLVLALHGILCAAILVVYLWSEGRRRDAQWPPPFREAPDKLEPPDLGYTHAERYPAPVVFTIMREYFPESYEQYRTGRLGYVERRWTWEACCSIYDARAEIEELCS